MIFDPIEKYGSKWIQELPRVVWGLRTQRSRATGYSPFFMVYGSEAILRILPSVLRTPRTPTKARSKLLGELTSTRLRSIASRQPSNMPDTSNNFVVTMTRIFSTATSTSAT